MCYNDATNIRGDGGVAFDQNKYISDFKKDNYDQMAFLVPKGKRKVIKDFANKQGLSISQLVIRALEEQYKLDLSK